MGNFTFDQDLSREKLANAIIPHEYPLSIVEHVGFKEFDTSLQPLYKMGDLQPLYKMISRNTIRDDIMRIYAIEKDKMINYMEKLEYRITITTYM